MTDADGDDYGDISLHRTARTLHLLDATGGLAQAGTDCNDSDNNTFPNAAPNDGAGCLTDVDGDDYASVASGGTDCDDSSNTVFPGATEVVADGIDQDCDVNNGDSCYDDSDGDSLGGNSVIASADLDCNDAGDQG